MPSLGLGLGLHNRNITLKKSLSPSNFKLTFYDKKVTLTWEIPKALKDDNILSNDDND